LGKTLPLVQLAPQTEDAFLAEELSNPLYILYRTLVVHLSTQTHLTDVFALNLHKRISETSSSLHNVVVQLTHAGAVLEFAFAEEWGFVVAGSATHRTLAQSLSIENSDTGTKFPSLEAHYKLAMRSDGKTEADVLSSLAPMKPFIWCQQVCGIRCFVCPPAKELEFLTVSVLCDRFVDHMSKQ
jgi:hypothetical protein